MHHEDVAKAPPHRQRFLWGEHASFWCWFWVVVARPLRKSINQSTNQSCIPCSCLDHDKRHSKAAIFSAATIMFAIAWSTQTDSFGGKTADGRLGLRSIFAYILYCNIIQLCNDHSSSSNCLLLDDNDYFVESFGSNVRSIIIRATKICVYHGRIGQSREYSPINLQSVRAPFSQRKRYFVCRASHVGLYMDSILLNLNILQVFPPLMSPTSGRTLKTMPCVFLYSKDNRSRRFVLPFPYLFRLLRYLSVFSSTIAKVCTNSYMPIKKDHDTAIFAQTASTPYTPMTIIPSAIDFLNSLFQHLQFECNIIFNNRARTSSFFSSTLSCLPYPSRLLDLAVNISVYYFALHIKYVYQRYMPSGPTHGPYFF